MFCYDKTIFGCTSVPELGFFGADEPTEDESDGEETEPEVDDMVVSVGCRVICVVVVVVNIVDVVVVVLDRLLDVVVVEVGLVCCLLFSSVEGGVIKESVVEEEGGVGVNVVTMIGKREVTLDGEMSEEDNALMIGVLLPVVVICKSGGVVVVVLTPKMSCKRSWSNGFVGSSGAMGSISFSLGNTISSSPSDCCCGIESSLFGSSSCCCLPVLLPMSLARS